MLIFTKLLWRNLSFSKKPLLNKLHDELAAAKDELLKAVKREEFEEAASLRDKIKFLEKKIKDHKE